MNAYRSWYWYGLFARGRGYFLVVDKAITVQIDTIIAPLLKFITPLSLKTVNVKWGKEKFSEIECNTDEAPLIFKSALYSLTGVVPERMKVMVKGKAIGVSNIYVNAAKTIYLIAYSVCIFVSISIIDPAVIFL